MAAKKRATPRRAMPTTFRLDQLDEEVRVALALPQRPGVSRMGDGVPFVHGEFTAAQRATITATMEAHVADPLWGEKQDERFIRLILGDADFDAYLAAPAATAPPPVVVRKLIRAVRALARMERNEAT